MRKAGKRLARCAATALGVATLCLLSAGGAQGADRVYWGSFGAIPFANLDRSGGGVLGTGGVIVNQTEGVAIDPVEARIYWADRVGNDPNYKIRFANLDGSGGGEFNTAGATVFEVEGLAVDPVGRRLYWANRSANKISFARLDGSGGGDLTTLTKPNSPSGIGVDPIKRRLYWINSGITDNLSVANLDGFDEHRLSTAGAEVNAVHGLAVDASHGRAYWANFGGGGSISFANLDGSGGGQLNTGGATVVGPVGIAVDPSAGRIYWANRVDDSISFASVDGSGNGGDIPTSLSGDLGDPQFPLLVQSPRSSASPTISGGSVMGTTLSCSRGTWAEDLIESFLYRAPRSFAFQWSRDGADIPGATQSALTVSFPGEYRCRVLAQGLVDSTAATSSPHRVSDGFGKDTGLGLELAGARIPAGGPIKVRIANANPFAITGTLSARSSKSLGAHARPVKLRARALKLAAKSKTVVRLTLPKPLRLALARTHKLSLALTATVTDPAGNRRVVKKTVVPKLKT